MLSGANREGVITDLLLGLQSVIYYVAACQPCRKVAYRRRRAKQAALERGEKALFESEQPQLFPHPSPFSTNLYWQEEISLGPGPPPQRAGTSRGRRSQRLGNSAQGSSVDSSRAASSRGGYVSPVGMQTPIELLTQTEETLTDENWNRRRYHREDEPLWGREIYRDARDEGGAGPGDRGLSGSSVGFPGVRRPVVSQQPCCALRNPPVNDYHPPVVSTPPLHRSETYWMLQPPPSAQVMAGKVPANGSRSNSGGSGQRGASVGLGRLVGEKALGRKVLRGERPPSAPSERHTLDGSGAPYSDEISSPDGQIDSKPPSPTRKKKRRPPPIEISEDSRSSEDRAVHIPIAIGMDGTPSKPPRTKRNTEGKPPAILSPPSSSSLSPTPPIHHQKRHSDPTPSDRLTPPLYLDVSQSPFTTSKPPLYPLPFKTEPSPSFPEKPLSPQKRDLTTHPLVLKEILPPNYALGTSRSSSPLPIPFPIPSEPCLPPPAVAAQDPSGLFRGDFKFPDLGAGGEGRGKGGVSLKTGRGGVVRRGRVGVEVEVLGRW